MYHILCRASTATSLAMLVMGSSIPVFAKPYSKSKVAIVSQAVTKSSVIDDAISPQPVDAILASVKFKQASQPKAKKSVVRPAMTTRSVERMMKTDYHVNADPADRGIDNFINVDGVKSRKHHAPAINRWIINN